MAAYQGFNPYGGYGVPAQMTQQMYPQMPQQVYVNQQQTQTPQPNVTVRLVTSKEEATTAQIQFDNTINVFVNPSANEIYIKRFNHNTGGAIFCTYIDEAKAAQAAQEAARPQKEFATIESLQALEQRVNELSEALTSKRTRSVKTDE